MYLFSFGWFSLGTSYLLARLVIAAEYTLGLLLIANFCPRLAWWGSVAMLFGFSLFLLGLMITGRHDNCHCFGERVDLNPAQSLLKNAGMLALLLLSTLPVWASAGAVEAEDDPPTFVDDGELTAVVEQAVEESLAGTRLTNVPVSVAVYFTRSGESWYYNGDEWYYTASLYKLPMIMRFTRSSG